MTMILRVSLRTCVNLILRNMSNVIFVKIRIIIGMSVLFEKEFFLKRLSLVLDSESSLVSKGYKSSNVLVASSSRSKTI